MLCAAKQMLFRYWPIFFVAGITQQVFQLNVLFPFESSRFTYGGMANDQVAKTGSTLTIIAFSCSFIFGLTLLTKIGRINHFNNGSVSVVDPIINHDHIGCYSFRWSNLRSISSLTIWTVLYLSCCFRILSEDSNLFTIDYSE